MAWVKKVAGITAGVAAGLFVLNMVTRYALPSFRSYFGLSA